MTDDTVAACRAALLKACHGTVVTLGGPPPFTAAEYVPLSVAAACMARAIEAIRPRPKRDDTGSPTQRHIDESAIADYQRDLAAALAAAQGGTDAA